MKVKYIFISPIKSCRLIPLSTLIIDRGVIEHDREFILIDAQKRFLSQRTIPFLSQVNQVIKGNILTVSFGDNSISISFDQKVDDAIEVSVWEKDNQEFRHCFSVGEKYNTWFSKILKAESILLKQDNDRLKQKDCGDMLLPISLHDSGGVHVIFEDEVKSLGLNEDILLTIQRFRPNIVIDKNEFGDLNSLENKIITIGDYKFFVRKKTIRCTIPYVNPGSGIVDDLPRVILDEKHKSENRVCFGVHLFPLFDKGTISLNDIININ